MERLARELQEIKKKYYAQKRKEQQQKEKERNLMQTSAQRVQQTDVPRFTGGGFNLGQINKSTVVQAL